MLFASSRFHHLDFVNLLEMCKVTLDLSLDGRVLVGDGAELMVSFTMVCRRGLGLFVGSLEELRHVFSDMYMFFVYVLEKRKKDTGFT